MFDGQKTKTGIGNPFQTYSNAVWPNTMKECLEWASYLYNRNAFYRKAIQNVVRYFINGLNITQKADIEDVSPEKVEMGKFLFEEKYKIIDLVRKAGEEQAAMGIVFISAVRKQARYLKCPKCGRITLLSKMRKDIDYKFKNFEFVGVCGNHECKSNGRQIVFSRYEGAPLDEEKIYFKIWPQEDIRIRYNQITGTCKYYYKIPEAEAQAIRSGDDIYLEDTPWEFIEAVRDNGYLLLDPAKLLVLKNDTLSTFDKLYKGWSAPLFLPSFPQILQSLLLDRFNEAVVMDYIVPIRLISPPAGALNAGADQNRTPINGAMFRNQMLSMINGSRGNPAQWVVSPTPVQYQMIGGEAKNLTPTDMLEWRNAQMMSNMNIPMEFRQTSFQMVSNTMGLRMFERMWYPFTSNLDACAQWAADQICLVEQKDPFIVTVNKTSFVEDDMNKQQRMGLAAQGAISQTTGLKAIGLEFEEETKLKMSEEQRLAELNREQATRNGNEEGIMQAMSLPPGGMMQAMNQQQMAMEAAQGGGGAGAPAAPAAPGAPMPPMGGGAPMGGAPDTGRMDDLMTQAEQIAGQIWNSPERGSVLRQLNGQNQALHDMVVGILERQDRQAMAQGLAQAKQQG